MRKGVSVAIDGPAGAGKSTVSKALAAKLGYDLLDTGAMYRAFAWILLKTAPTSSQSWAEEIRRHQIDTSWANGATSVACDGRDISADIRSAEVTRYVSEVAADPELRQIAVLAQRQYVDKALSQGKGVVLEGRDIGSTVLPDADLKFFLTADPEERARRRALETGQGLDSTRESLLARDAADSSRAASPLAMAEDAQLVDATFRTVEEVVALMAAKVAIAEGRLSDA